MLLHDALNSSWSWLAAHTAILQLDFDHPILTYGLITLKWVFVPLIIVNWRSFPLLYHIRAFNHIVRYELYRFAFPWTSAGRRKWLTDICPVGENPLDKVLVYKGRASIADCDHYGHLSNSSFAKNADIARYKFSVEAFAGFSLERNCWAGLGATHFQFIREIPLWQKYEIRSSIAGWDEKWMYFLHQFVTYPSQKSKRPNSNSKLDGQESTAERLSADLSPLPEGAVLNSLGIVVYCFKYGRLTVPPTIPLIICGMGEHGKDRWPVLLDIRKKGVLPEVLKGGWNDKYASAGGNGEYKFWELEECWERNKKNMVILNKLREGMEGLRP